MQNRDCFLSLLRNYFHLPNSGALKRLRKKTAVTLALSIVLGVPLLRGQQAPGAKPLEVENAQVAADSPTLQPVGPIQPGPGVYLPGSDIKPAKRIKTGGKYDVTKIGDRDIGGGLNLYSLEKERALGRSLALQIEENSRVITDPVITEYINRVGQNLVRHSDAKVPFVIKVIDSDEVNAFALPGGYFYVDSGLILAADNEAELAGVMAHEIAHVAARHATKNRTKAEIFNIATIPLIFLGGPAGLAIREVAGFAVPLSMLKFSRNAEREADLLGLEYAYASGYDPAEFVRFFEELNAREKDKKNIIAKAFASHPMTADRIKRAQKEIATMLPARREYIVDTSEFQEVKARLVRLQNRLSIHIGPSEGPTLRRRGPEKEDDRPTLKRRPN